MANSFIELYRRQMAEQGTPDDTPDYYLIKDVLGPFAEQNRDILKQYPDFEQEWRQIREANAPGAIQGIFNTGKSAFDSSVQAKNVIGTPDAVDAQDIADRELAIRNRPSSVPWEDWQRTKGAEAFKTFLRDPIEITSNIVAAGLAGSLPALGGGLAGGAAGAAAGSAVPGIGNIVGGTVGAALGTGAGSLAVEYGSKYLDVLREAGADLADPESILRVVSDPEIRARARDMGLARGLPVAAFDAASAGLAGKFIKGLKAGATTSQKAVAGVKEALAQGATGGGGEVAGALSAGEEISPGAIFEEVIGELGPGAVEVGGSAARSRFADPATSEIAPLTPAIAPLPQNIAPLTPDAGLPTQVNQVFTPASAPAAGRSNQEIVVSVEAMLPEQKIARFTELSTFPAPSPDQQTELELLRAEVPRDVAFPPATSAANFIPPSPEPAATVTTEITPSPVSTDVPGAPASPTSPQIQYTIQRPQVLEGRTIPGYIQVERSVDARGEPLTEAERAQFPTPPEWMPTGQFTLQEVLAAIEAGPPKVDPALATAQPKPSEMRPDLPELARPSPSVVETIATNPASIGTTPGEAVPLSPALLERQTFEELRGQTVVLEGFAPDGTRAQGKVDAAQAWQEAQSRRKVYGMLLDCLNKST